MNISIVSLFPELYEPFLKTSLLKKAQTNNQIAVSVAKLFDYATPKERVDGPTFGHGSGMVLKPEIMEKAINDQESKHGKAFKIFFSPHGKKLDQNLLKKLAQIFESQKHIMLLPARYEGMDSRIEQVYADEVISIGDYVLMGGDMPAMVFMEGILRLLPGIVGKTDSVENDSFQDAFVDYPEYTDPLEWKGLTVPEILRSGNHKEMLLWRRQEAVKRTLKSNFDWLRQHIYKKEDIELTYKNIPSHYAVLMHDEVILALEKDKVYKEGTSSVTSLDIHDIARSAKTFGIKKYFLVTPLKDQQKIIEKLLGFWQTGVGVEYNAHRHEALSSVVIAESIEEVVKIIEAEENKEPLLVATGAKKSKNGQRITYFDQATVWNLERPVVLVFGTAKGLSSTFINKCDFILEPIDGFSNFNHLSVRSAAAIVFDRWLGINRIIIV